MTLEHSIIQGGSGRNVNILSGDTTGRYQKRKVYMIMCLIVNG